MTDKYPYREWLKQAQAIKQQPYKADTLSLSEGEDKNGKGGRGG